VPRLITIPAEAATEFKALMEQGRRWKKTALLSPQAFSATRRQVLAALAPEGPIVALVPVAEKAALILQSSHYDGMDVGNAMAFGKRRRELAEVFYYLVEHGERVDQ
jgi:hypothetical protein